MATPDAYGRGLDVIYDWPLRFTYASGFKNLGNNLCRRLQTVRGSMPWDPNCGWNVRQLLRGKFAPADLNAAQNAIGAECEKDERVNSATCALSFVSNTLLIRVTGDGADGPFSLVLAANDLTVSLLEFTQ